MASLLYAICFLSLFFYISPAFSSSCTSMKFVSKKTFSNCSDLPALGAFLHWTYDQSHSSLSMAFTAKPPSANGWVAWAINPKDTGMVGAQTVWAYKASSKDPISVNTVDIKGYSELKPGPISYNVTGISAEESSDGNLTIFATWAIPKSESMLNTVWQVGPSQGGKPSKHAVEKENLSAKMMLELSGKGGSTNMTAPAPGPEPNKGSGVSLSPMHGFGLALVALVTSLL